MAETKRWFSGVRVLDLTRLLPGPFCTQLLADMGAEVLKVERPEGGDYARQYPPKIDGISAFFAAVNRNKRSLTLDLKTDEGVEIFEQLVGDFDVLVESFRPGVMERLGFGNERLLREHPELVYCSISGYGADGPFEQRAGHDLNYMARSGLLHQNARAGDPPVVPGFQLADIAGGGLYTALAIAGALFDGTRTGEGAYVDVSMTEGALSLHSTLQAAVGAGSDAAPGTRTLTGGVPCYSVYETKEGKYLAVGALEPKFWMKLLEIVGLPELAAEGHAKGESGESVRRKLQEAFEERNRTEWMEAFEGEDVCVEPVQSPEEVVEDELFRARDVFFELSGIRHTKTPLTPSDRDHDPAPALGENTADVLSDLGRDPEAIETLRERGVV